MAFPATYNFSYYKGDTLQFNVYPKDNSGAPFSLDDFEVSFTIADKRGFQATQVEAYATIIDSTHISCAITPENSAALPGGSTFVYDIEIRKVDNQPYPLVYTILTGTITTQEQVTYVELEPTLEPAGIPTNLEVTVLDTTAKIEWARPTTGGDPESYIVGYSLQSNPLLPVFTETISATITEYEFEGLTPETAYIFAVAAINDANTSTPTPATQLATTLVLRPGTPTNLAVSATTSSSISITWEAPSSGGAVAGYIAAIAPQSDPTNITQIPLLPNVFTYTFTPLPPDTAFFVGVVSVNEDELTSDPLLSTLPAATEA